MSLQTIKQQLRQKIKDNSFSRKIESKGGIINFNKLSFYKTTDKLYLKQLENSGKKYYVELLVDCSGSIDNIDNKKYYKIVYDVINTFDGIININVSFFNLDEFSVSSKSILTKHKKLFMDGLLNVYNIKDKLTGSKRSKIIEGYTKEGSKSLFLPGKKHLYSSPRYYEASVDYPALCGNCETINVLRAVDRLSNVDGEKIILLIQDGIIAIYKYGKIGRLEEENINLFGYQPKEYSIENTLNVCKNNGIHLYSFMIGSQDPRVPKSNAFNVTVDNVYAKILELFDVIINNKKASDYEPSKDMKSKDKKEKDYSKISYSSGLSDLTLTSYYIEKSEEESLGVSSSSLGPSQEDKETYDFYGLQLPAEQIISVLDNLDKTSGVPTGTNYDMRENYYISKTGKMPKGIKPLSITTVSDD